MKSIRGILLSLLLLLALTACAGAGERTAEPEETEEEETVKIREIRKICTTASPAPELSLKGVGESVRAARTVRSVTLSGYPEKMIGGNIENWALSALNDNRSIVDQIAIAGGAGFVTTSETPFPRSRTEFPPGASPRRGDGTEAAPSASPQRKRGFTGILISESPRSRACAWTGAERRRSGSMPT